MMCINLGPVLLRKLGRDRTSRNMIRMVNSRFRLCTSVVPSPMSVVFGLGTRLYVRMCTKIIENGVFPNGQQPQSVVNDQGEFEDAEWS